MLKRYLIVFTVILSLGWAQNPIASQFSNAFADVAEKVNPAVVTILAVKEVQAEQYHRNNPFDQFFPEEYFRPERRGFWNLRVKVTPRTARLLR